MATLLTRSALPCPPASQVTSEAAAGLGPRARRGGTLHLSSCPRTERQAQSKSRALLTAETTTSKDGIFTGKTLLPEEQNFPHSLESMLALTPGPMAGAAAQSHLRRSGWGQIHRSARLGVSELSGSLSMEGLCTPGYLFLGGYRGIQMLSPQELFNQPSAWDITTLCFRIPVSPGLGPCTPEAPNGSIWELERTGPHPAPALYPFA